MGQGKGESGERVKYKASVGLGILVAVTSEIFEWNAESTQAGVGAFCSMSLPIQSGANIHQVGTPFRPYPNGRSNPPCKTNPEAETCGTRVFPFECSCLISASLPLTSSSTNHTQHAAGAADSHHH